MQEVLGYMRRAITDYNLIENGDKIAVAISGGKDSLILLKGLAMLRQFIGIDYEIMGITLDPCFDGKNGDYTTVKSLCDEYNIEYIIKRTNIAEVVFDIRKEKNPCSLCARLRRGILHSTAKAHSCNKIALGHHRDDAIETFIMNLFNEGRIANFSPKSYLSRKDLTMIRPLCYTPEKAVRRAMRRTNLKVVKSPCPVDKTTNREKTKQFISAMDAQDRGFSIKVFGAFKKGLVDWQTPDGR